MLCVCVAACSAISMGQGQEVHARRLVGRYMQSGGWALLQNCHLGLDFMDELLEIVLETPSIHERFRVWITTEVHDTSRGTTYQSINLLTHIYLQG
jgi:hypothetical protein